MKILLLLPLLLGFSVPAIAHNEFNGGDISHCGDNACEVGQNPNREIIDAEEGEGAETEVIRIKRKGLFN